MLFTLLKFSKLLSQNESVRYMIQLSNIYLHFTVLIFKIYPRSPTKIKTKILIK